MELGDWARYFAQPPADRRKLYNIVSLSLANTPLEVSEVHLAMCAGSQRQQWLSFCVSCHQHPRMKELCARASPTCRWRQKRH